MRSVVLPVSKQFWVCHLTGWLALVAISILLASVYGDPLLAAVVESIIMAVLCTGVCLGFRSVYYKQNWQLKNPIALVPLLLGVAVTLGFIVALIQVSVLWFGVAAWFLPGAEFSSDKYYFQQLLVGRWADVSYILMAWLLLYVLFVGQRERVNSGAIASIRCSSKSVIFWACHLSAWAVIIFFTVLLGRVFSMAFVWVAAIVVGIVMAVFSNIAGLWFRQYMLRKQDLRRVTPKQVIYFVCVAILLGFVVGLVHMSAGDDAISILLSWYELPTPEQQLLMVESRSVTQDMVGSWRAATHVVLLWVLLYCLIEMFSLREAQHARAITEKQVAYWPMNKLFWAFHLSGWCVVAVIYMVLDVWFGPDIRLVMLLLNVCLMALLGTIFSLMFRQLFYQRGWYKRESIQLIPNIIVLSVLMGFLQVHMQSPLLVWIGSFFWLPEELLTLQSWTEKFSPLAVSIGNWMYVTFCQAAWLLIYIMVIAYRSKRRTELEKLQLENSLKDAQLNTLISQVNPHFMFNGLNNIKSLMRENVGRAGQTITALSDVLRFSLNSSKHDKVTIKEELAMIHNYLALSSIQYEERLQYVEQVPDSSLDFLLPPMSLQILIENAIKHGISHLAEGGQLSLSINDNTDCLVCQVRNDGSLQSQHRATGTGTGLVNIRERLALLYGENAELQLDEQQGQVIATMTLPKESAL